MNMTYCNFENTLQDLLACRDALDAGVLQRKEELSASEQRAIQNLILVCADIAEEYGEEVDGERDE
jgi:hypothetical protein